MDGLIIINKTSGMTSHDVVNKIRRIFNTKRVGHLGTLDPDATGVLVVCINDATKLVQFLDQSSKTYQATILIGIETDTLDLSGTIIKQEEVKEITNELIDKYLLTFLGKSSQIPPIYSAIKVNGKKLYEYARNGKDIEILPRDIEIYNIERISDVIINDNKTIEFKIEVCVSKGTYIRSLARDIAYKLGYPGLMKDLVRTKSGIFDIKYSYTIEDIEKGDYQIISLLDALKEYPILNNSELKQKAIHGMRISINYIKSLLNETPNRIVISSENKIIAIYELDQKEYCYKAVRVWN